MQKTCRVTERPQKAALYNYSIGEGCNSCGDTKSLSPDRWFGQCCLKERQSTCINCFDSGRTDCKSRTLKKKIGKQKIEGTWTISSTGTYTTVSGAPITVTFGSNTG